MKYSIRLCTLLIALIFTGCGSGGSSRSGETQDGGTQPPAQTIPVAPTGLNAAPGSGQVVLTWTASTGATSYHVKRGDATGGPYAQVGAPTGTTFTNTGLTNSKTYYYVVSALNALGESGNLNKASATPAAITTTTPVPPTAYVIPSCTSSRPDLPAWPPCLLSILRPPLMALPRGSR